MKNTADKILITTLEIVVAFNLTILEKKEDKSLREQTKKLFLFQYKKQMNLNI